MHPNRHEENQPVQSRRSGAQSASIAFGGAEKSFRVGAAGWTGKKESSSGVGEGQKQ
jgi:hypothetical protein